MRKQLIGALGAASLAVCGAALAAPTLVGTPDNASGIDGVVVDAVTYDVTFSTSSFDSTFSTASTAKAAAVALAADLNTLSVTGLSFGGADGSDCTGPISCGVFAGSLPAFAEAVSGLAPTPLWAATDSPLIDFPLRCPQNLGEGVIKCFEAAHWNKVTSSSVPEPATLALLGLGLVGVGLSRRRLAR